MALRLGGSSLVHALFPAAHAPLRPAIANPLLRPLPQLLPPIRIPATLATLISIPSLLGEIWESIVRAVPKKKTSHMKKRHRQMAGKALKNVTSMCRCSSCGRVKLMQTLCPYCVESVQKMARSAAKLFPAGMLRKRGEKLDFWGKFKRDSTDRGQLQKLEGQAEKKWKADRVRAKHQKPSSFFSNIYAQQAAKKKQVPETKGWAYVGSTAAQPTQASA